MAKIYPDGCIEIRGGEVAITKLLTYVNEMKKQGCTHVHLSSFMRGDVEIQGFYEQ